jgi:hypothetical protein
VVVDAGRHCRTSRAGGSQSRRGLTANESPPDELESDGWEPVDTELSREM